MTLAEIIIWIGKLCVAFYFLWSAYFNQTTREFHISEFTRIGISQGSIAVNLGIIWTLVSIVLFLIPSTTVVGGLMIIFFIIAADVLFHRFWKYDDPQESTLHKVFLFEHVALIGGILGLIASSL